MMNPKKLMELNRLKNEFADRHPKFWNFVQKVGGEGISTDTVIEISITRPDGTKISGNMRVMQEDMELLDSLRELK